GHQTLSSAAPADVADAAVSLVALCALATDPSRRHRSGGLCHRRLRHEGRTRVSAHGHRPARDRVVRPIVFLHIPKTAGQTIHNQLAQMVGAGSVSPIRVQSQAPKGPQMPAGYGLYSGHIDWTELETL